MRKFQIGAMHSRWFGTGLGKANPAFGSVGLGWHEGHLSVFDGPLQSGEVAGLLASFRTVCNRAGPI